MNRRTFVGMAAGGVIGLIGIRELHPFAADNDEFHKTESGESAQMDSSKGGNSQFPGISVVAGPIDEGREAEIAATVKNQPSATDPARVTVEFTNTASSERWVTFGNFPPFSEHISDQSSAVLIPENYEGNPTPVEYHEGERRIGLTDIDMPPKETKDGCWNIPTDLYYVGEGKAVQLAAGETISNSFSLFGYESCLDTGKYTFTSENYFGDGDSLVLTVAVE